jgi:quercetin dioxygenase-like cupin family protein
MTTPSMPEGTVLGPIGDGVIFENEIIRVWRLELPPGGIQGWHRHDHPYLIVPMTEGTNIMRFSDGRVRNTEEKPGEVLWREPGIPHELENAGTANYGNILIEFKQASSKV